MNPVEKRVAFFAAIIYLVGIAGYLTPSLRPLVLPLTALNICLALFVSFLFHKKWSFPMVLGLLFCGISGFLLEVAGVKTGWIFGHYHYGPTLGKKIEAVPWVLAVNWMGMIYYTANLCRKWFKNRWAVASVGAAMMVAFDWIMEPVAMHYHYWHWLNNHIPLQNYLAWFGASFVLHAAYFSADKPAYNKLATFIFCCQTMFFIVLRVLI